MERYNKNKAFTLMELLIAMLIFAIVAVMLVPNVTRNAEKELFATQIKKVQNDVQQALMLIMSKNQNTLMNFPGGTAETFIKEGIRKQLETKTVFNNTNQNSGSSDAQEAYKGYVARNPKYLDESTDANLDVNTINSFQAIRLRNGATVSVIYTPDCNYNQSPANDVNLPAKCCGYVEIDVNSEKAPNIVGKDIHYFWMVDQDGLVPFGELNDGAACGDCANDQAACTKDNYPENINNATAKDFLGCTARVLNRGKIDYY